MLTIASVCCSIACSMASGTFRQNKVSKITRSALNQYLR